MLSAKRLRVWSWILLAVNLIGFSVICVYLGYSPLPMETPQQVAIWVITMVGAFALNALLLGVADIIDNTHKPAQKSSEQMAETASGSDEAAAIDKSV